MTPPVPSRPPGFAGPALGPTRVLVDACTVLDSRLALYHRDERWLAVADVHYGYELSQRAAGGLFPLWGMDSIETRLRALLEDYRPARLIVAGDFVHDRTAREPALALVRRLSEVNDGCEIVLVAGNHDRRAFSSDETCRFFVTDGFYFHHGDGAGPTATELGRRTVIIGHHHPAGTLSDGAGTSIKLPAFVQTAEGPWVLPAFSPWAAGGGGGFGRGARRWLCGPKRILPPR